MADESNVPKNRYWTWRRIRFFGLVVASVVALGWGTLVAFHRFPGWEIPIGIAIAAAFALAILWKIPQWQVGKVTGLDPKERFDRVNEARKTLAQIIGGIAVLAGFYSTIQNINVAREGQITDRFTKAIDQLGAVDASGKKKLEVRLGGIYALNRIADESERDRGPIVEVLTAYVRDNAPRQNADNISRGSTQIEMPSDVKPATDIQAILNVLCRSRRRRHYYRLDLQKTDIRGADLLGAKLLGADLRGAVLTRAHLLAADLSWAELTGADLRGADLRGAVLTEAHLSGADLSGADLTDANLRWADLREANLTRADLSGANLRDAKNLTQKQIDSATGNRRTELPSNLHMPEAWKRRF